MRGGSILKKLSFAVFSLLFFALPIAAQTAASPNKDEDLLTYYYKDPRPERLSGFLDRFNPPEGKWNAYPAVVGFYAYIFRKHPDWIEKLVPTRLDARLAETIAAALRLSGQQEKAQGVLARLKNANSDPRLRAEFTDLPGRVEDLQVKTATHMDILWGASFASGDGQYTRKLIEFFAQTTNRSEPIALDTTRAVVAMMGGPGEILGQLRGKYGDNLAREIIFAAAALWATSSNAQQHPFVNNAVLTYIQAHPDQNAVKALMALRK